jgi:hypothetical protein
MQLGAGRIKNFSSSGQRSNQKEENGSRWLEYLPNWLLRVRAISEVAISKSDSLKLNSSMRLWSSELGSLIWYIPVLFCIFRH